MVWMTCDVTNTDVAGAIAENHALLPIIVALYEHEDGTFDSIRDDLADMFSAATEEHQGILRDFVHQMSRAVEPV